jgi:formamidopyrimidine-DNA glycosylase
MPEGPELWYLGRVLAGVLGPGRSVAVHGKHLVLDATHHHFGLTGGLRAEVSGAGPGAGPGALTPAITLRHHYGEGRVAGFEKPITASEAAVICAQGLDWMTAPPVAIAKAIRASARRKKVLGTWMLDQSIIAGVGVTWASEIAAVAGVDVAAHMNVQNLSKLADAYVVVRDRVAAVYTAALPPPGDVDAACAAINAWYGNLYAVRAPVMTVHGVGVPVTVGGRNFWKPRVVS